VSGIGFIRKPKTRGLRSVEPNNATLKCVAMP
jgi:hypothetical protein